LILLDVFILRSDDLSLLRLRLLLRSSHVVRLRELRWLLEGIRKILCCSDESVAIVRSYFIVLSGWSLVLERRRSFDHDMLLLAWLGMEPTGLECKSRGVPLKRRSEINIMRDDSSLD
jgi:hypothetical protein